MSDKRTCVGCGVDISHLHGNARRCGSEACRSAPVPPRTRPPLPNPSGLCFCGCGAKTARARTTVREYGYVAGEHVRYIKGHIGSTRPLLFEEAIEIAPGGCWVWHGSRSPAGYGYINIDGPGPAHRAFYEGFVGPIPDGLHIDHLCRNRACVNPGHLEPVTTAENSRRGAMALLSMDKARAIRESPERAIDLAERYGVSPSTISNVRAGRIWREA